MLLEAVFLLSVNRGNLCFSSDNWEEEQISISGIKQKEEVYVKKIIVCSFMAIGCGSDGSDGKDGASVNPEDIQGMIDNATASLQNESCAVCHSKAGIEHQAKYTAYKNASEVKVKITAVALAPATLTFTVTKNGQPYLFSDSASFKANFTGGNRFYIAGYDATNKGVSAAEAYDLSTGTITVNGGGSYTITKATTITDNSSLAYYGYVVLSEQKINPSDTTKVGRINMFNNVAEDIQAVSGVDGDLAYVSTANVDGCSQCHESPYMKHGYQKAVGAVDGDNKNFLSCKTCHQYNKTGDHGPEWMMIKDDPQMFAKLYNGELTDAQKATLKTKYAYTANLMNDVHLSHAFEFAYPQSMRNCVACHDGKLNQVLTDANFTLPVCKSCHPVNGGKSASGKYDFTGIALTTLANKNYPLHSFDTMTVCTPCHVEGQGKIAPSFKEIHSGYDPLIYAADGTRYSNTIKVNIESVNVAGDNVTYVVSATGNVGSIKASDIVYTFAVGLYGYNTKDFIVNGHANFTDKCGASKRVGEFSSSATIDPACGNPYWAQPVKGSDGKWTVTFKLGEFADKIKSGVVKRVEVAALPALSVLSKNIGIGDNATAKSVLGISAVSKTVDLNAKAFVTSSDIADVAKCNKCHDQLATTFHNGAYGGSVTVCRLCHVTLAGGSHLEMQSRSIDSYIHSIHTFQVFDTKNINFSDPVEKVFYEHHLNSTYPTFSTTDCESCHVAAGTYEVPDVSKSLPGLLSASSVLKTTRNIGTVPSYVTGPASRACGSCHRAEAISYDKAGDLAALNSHTASFGYMKEAKTGVLEAIIEKLFK